MNARLDPRDRILCAVRDCAEPLGFVLALGVGKTAERIVVLPIGWRPRDGVWRPTAHAAKHHAMHGTYTNRSAPKWADTPSMKSDRKMVRVYPMPARIKCPAPGCGMEQVLDPVVLRYSTSWRPTPVTLLGKQVDAGPALVMVPREIAEEKGF